MLFFQKSAYIEKLPADITVDNLVFGLTISHT